MTIFGAVYIGSDAGVDGSPGIRSAVRISSPEIYPATVHVATFPTALPPGIEEVLIVSVVATSSTLVRITFNVPVLDTPALRLAGNYSITGGAVAVTPLAVAPQPIAAPTYVDLTTTEMKQGQAYSFELYTIEAA